MPTDSITCPEENSRIRTAIKKFEHIMLVPKVHNVYNVYTKGECPTPVCPVQTHCVKLWCNMTVYCCLLSDKINPWQVYKESINKQTLSQSHLLQAKALMKMYPELMKTLRSYRFT